MSGRRNALESDIRIPAPDGREPPLPAWRNRGRYYGSRAVIVSLIGLLILYFAPAIIISLRGRQSSGAIFALNLLFGWTLLGWVIALAWSLTANATSKAAGDPLMVAGSAFRLAALRG